MASRPISPAEPPKRHPPPIQPNAHPYAIKTTSSALLSRSNWSPHSTHHTRHHYIPSSSSHIPTGAKMRHRHSSSLSSVEGEACNVNGMCTIPTPLPTPPSTASPDNPSESLKCADEPKLAFQVWGTETIPDGPTQPITENHIYEKFNHDQDSRVELYASLPPNPKQWNTDELTTYLESSFKLGHDTNGDIGDSSFMDILEYIRTRSLTGRGFLRLADADLAGTPLSDVQRAQLLDRSCTLRADVLRGCIYVNSYHSHEVSHNSRDIYSQSARPSTPFCSLRGASASADDLRLPVEDSRGEDGTFPLSPVMSLHRSNSVSDATTQRYRDLARMRMRRRGRVKGLIETWERASTSGSECSTSDAESESETDPEFESTPNAKRLSASPSVSPSSLQDEPSHHVCPSGVDPAIVPQEPPLLIPASLHACMHSGLGDMGDEEEPSIEELLELSLNSPLRGARAWEADFGLGETVKRIPGSASTNADSAKPLVTGPDIPVRPKDDGEQTKSDSIRSKGSESGVRRSTGSRGKNAKLQKRVVTAIFTGSPSDAGDEMPVRDRHRCESGANHVVRCMTSTGLDLQNDPDSAVRALEQSIIVTRAQLDVFRLRLETVEADIARQEATLMRAQCSDSSEFELRQRRSVANDRPTETGELRDETFVEDSKNRDVIEGWETMSLADIAQALVTRAMGWLFPYGHMGAQEPEDHNNSRARNASRPEMNDRYHSLAKRNGRLPVVRMSCSIILVSFAICAAVLRRMGLRRWVRQP